MCLSEPCWSLFSEVEACTHRSAAAISFAASDQVSIRLVTCLQSGLKILKQSVLLAEAIFPFTPEQSLDCE